MIGNIILKMLKRTGFIILFLLFYCLSHAQNIESYSCEVLGANDKYIAELIIFSDEKYLLSMDYHISNDQIIGITLSSGQIIKKGDILIFKDSIIQLELEYKMKHKDTLHPIKSFCFFNNQEFILFRKEHSNSKTFNDYEDQEFSENRITRLKWFQDSENIINHLKYDIPIDTGLYCYADTTVIGTFYAYPLNKYSFALHANGYYELLMNQKIVLSKGYWEQNNRLLILHDECLNYKNTLIIREDKKLCGIFPMYDYFFGEAYFINSKIVDSGDY